MITVLFLCTGNSARSILAEVLCNHAAPDRIRALSAGSRPTGQVNPGAIEVLKLNGHATEGLRSKSWDEFSGPDATPIDLVVTVCDNAAGESCPLFTGTAIKSHWGLPDPAAAEGAAATRKAFASTYARLRRRIDQLVGADLDLSDPQSLATWLSTIHAQALEIEQSQP